MKISNPANQEQHRDRSQVAYIKKEPDDQASDTSRMEFSLKKLKYGAIKF